MEVENLGEALAFDVQISDLHLGLQHSGSTAVTSTRFKPLPLLATGKRLLQPIVDPSIPITTDSFGQPSSEFGQFIDLMVKAALDHAVSLYDRGKLVSTGKPIREMRLDFAQLILSYKNARGRQFSSTFVLTAGPEPANNGHRKIECLPMQSLVEQTSG